MHVLQQRGYTFDLHICDSSKYSSTFILSLNYLIIHLVIQQIFTREFPETQWLGLHASTVRAQAPHLVREVRSCMRHVKAKKIKVSGE